MQNKYINKFIAPKKYKAIMINFFAEAAMEIGLNALISVQNLTEKGFVNIVFHNLSEFISNTLCFGCLIALLISPVFTLFQARRYKLYYYDERARKKYESLF